MLRLFVAATDTYGLPVRIRCDQGVENYDVAMYMLNHHDRGPLMKPVIVGRSVHNQRIERLWRDVCGHHFYLLSLVLASGTDWFTGCVR